MHDTMMALWMVLWMALWMALARCGWRRVVDGVVNGVVHDTMIDMCARVGLRMSINDLGYLNLCKPSHTELSHIVGGISIQGYDLRSWEACQAEVRAPSVLPAYTPLPG